MSLPPEKYGGTERVVWYLAKEQEKAGHEVRFLWGNAPNLPSNAIVGDKRQPIPQQIDDWPDIVHFHRPYTGELHKPYVCTEHGNAQAPTVYSQNCIFLSKSHAQNHGAECFVYNGLDWKDYGAPNLNNNNAYCHFLGKAKAPSKNLQGTVQIARDAGVRLSVLGGGRFNLKRNPYAYFDRKLRFHGMVGGAQKLDLIRGSAALLFPVRWHEPFGLAITESLYLGCPVIATPYGSLPELITSPEVGVLSDSYATLTQATANLQQFDRQACHELARERFNSQLMAVAYQHCYERVLAGEYLNAVQPRSAGGLQTLLPIKP